MKGKDERLSIRSVRHRARLFPGRGWATRGVLCPRPRGPGSSTSSFVNGHRCRLHFHLRACAGLSSAAGAFELRAMDWSIHRPSGEVLACGLWAIGWIWLFCVMPDAWCHTHRPDTRAATRRRLGFGGRRRTAAGATEGSHESAGSHHCLLDLSLSHLYVSVRSRQQASGIR